MPVTRVRGGRAGLGSVATTYTLKGGDAENPARIAAKFGVSVADLAAANPDVSFDASEQQPQNFNFNQALDGQSELRGAYMAATMRLAAGSLNPTYYSSAPDSFGNRVFQFPLGPNKDAIAVPAYNVGSLFFADGSWRTANPWGAGQTINVPGDDTTGGGGGDITPPVPVVVKPPVITPVIDPGKKTTDTTKDDGVSTGVIVGGALAAAALGVVVVLAVKKRKKKRGGSSSGRRSSRR